MEQLSYGERAVLESVRMNGHAGRGVTPVLLSITARP
jgi:hypothetical protein